MNINDYIRRTKAAFERGERFLKHDIWYIGKPGESIPSGFVVKQLRVAILLIRGMLDEALLLRASALAFATLLFLVPFLVFMFSFIQTFHLGDHLYGQVSEWLDSRIDRVVQVVKTSEKVEEQAESAEAAARGEIPPDAELAPDGSPVPEDGVRREDTLPDSGLLPEEGVIPPEEGGIPPQDVVSTESDRELADVILKTMFPTFSDEHAEGEFTDPVDLLVGMVEDKATDIRTLGLTGLMYVLITVLGLMRNVEWSFNQIWGVVETRGLLRTLSDYTLITLLLPFVAAIMLGITAALTTNDALGHFSIVLRGTQVMIISLTFSLLYYFVPNTSVRPRCALMGGLVAGILWSLTAWAYVTFNVGLAKYTFFFSAFALFPMFLAWIYTSWGILLFGALVTFAYQNEKTFALERLANRASFAYREAVALRVAIEIARRYAAGEAAPTVVAMAEDWNVPSRLINEAIDVLVEAGIVTPCTTQPVTYQLTRAAEKIAVLDVLNAIREEGEDPSMLRNEDEYKALYEGLSSADATITGATVADLVARKA